MAISMILIAFPAWQHKIWSSIICELQSSFAHTIGPVYLLTCLRREIIYSFDIVGNPLWRFPLLLHWLSPFSGFFKFVTVFWIIFFYSLYWRISTTTFCLTFEFYLSVSKTSDLWRFALSLFEIFFVCLLKCDHVGVYSAECWEMLAYSRVSQWAWYEVATCVAASNDLLSCLGVLIVKLSSFSCLPFASLFNEDWIDGTFPKLWVTKDLSVCFRWKSAWLICGKI